MLSTTRCAPTETNFIITLCYHTAQNSGSINQLRLEWWWKTSAESRVRSIDTIIIFIYSDCGNVILLTPWYSYDYVAFWPCDVTVTENPNIISTFQCEVSKSSYDITILSLDAVTPS